MSYIWEARESGSSDYARQVVLEGISKLEKLLPAGNIAYIHRVDNVLFSHAGLTEIFVSHFLPNVMEQNVYKYISYLSGDRIVVKMILRNILHVQVGI